MSTCRVPRLASPPRGPADAVWEGGGQAAVALFHARSSQHRPEVAVRIGHTGDRLHLRFAVRDRWVISRIQRVNGPVCTDSCVEFFVEPLPGGGYFNVEVNAGGTVHCSHITDPTPVPGGFAGCAMLSADEIGAIAVDGSLPRMIDPEIADPVDWTMCLGIPLSLFSARLGRTPPVPGTWRGNFYKCADHSSHPHWASWAPIDERLAFHVPHRFGTLELLP